MLLVLYGKLVLFLLRTFNLGTGSTWPGHLALEINSKFIRNILNINSSVLVVLVAGTNGKTTTALILQKILEAAGLRVFRNEAGANLLNGVASSIIANANFAGHLNFDAAIFEVDENNVCFAVREIRPLAVTLLNVFRDQLDRYGEVNKVINDWRQALKKIPSSTLVFINGDDPVLSYILKNSRRQVHYFGIREAFMSKKKTGHDVDFIYCPNCQTKLIYAKVSYSHMGKFRCEKCGFKNPKTETFSTLPRPFVGTYNIYNANASALVASKAFGISRDVIQKALLNIKPAFGRQEKISYKGRKVMLLLSKNPTGFNQSLDAVKSLNKKGNFLIALNDRIPDGRDVSWIWDVDFDNLPKDAKLFISGDRAYDMGLRIKYSSIIHNPEFLIQNLNEAIETAVRETKPNQTLFILPTYSAMLDIRKILTGKKIL